MGQLEISATDVDDTVYTWAHVVTSKEALEGQVNTNLETPFPARNATIELSGSVYREGGEILAPAGLTVTAAIVWRPKPRPQPPMAAIASRLIQPSKRAVRCRLP